MALITRDAYMFSLDFERELVVIKVFSKAVHTIVAIQAGHPVGKSMGCCKGRIHLTMTVGTGFGIKFGDVSAVAILAGERFTRLRELVTV